MNETDANHQCSIAEFIRYTLVWTAGKASYESRGYPGNNQSRKQAVHKQDPNLSE